MLTYDEYKKKKKEEEEETIAPVKTDTTSSIMTYDDYKTKYSKEIEEQQKKAYDKAAVTVGTNDLAKEENDRYYGISLEDLQNKRKELWNSYSKSVDDDPLNREWWNGDDNVFSNVGNVFYKLFLEKNSEIKNKSEKTKQLEEELSELDEYIKNRQTENYDFGDGVVGFMDKQASVIAGGIMSGFEGIESSVQKILGADTNSSQTLTEKISDKALQESSGAEKVILDISRSIGQMTPSLIAPNATAANVLSFANFGGAAYNEAKRNGSTEEQATTYGLVVGGMETMLNKLLPSFSIDGKNVFGKTASDKVLTSVMGKITSNAFLRRTLTEGAGEFTEEYLQQFLEPIIKEVILDEDNGVGIKDEDNALDIAKNLASYTANNFFSEENLYAGLLGFATSGVMGAQSNIDAYRYEKNTGRNYETGLTSNEQAIVDKVVEDRISEAGKDGNKLSKKEKTNIEEQVKEELQKGYISTDTIESALGGETYQEYKNNQDKLDKLNSEISQLEKYTSKDNLKNISAEDWNNGISRLNALREEIKTIDTNTLKTKLDTEIGGKIANDGYLQESYYEKGRRSETFQADVTKYDVKQQETIQKAIDSGILNNTRKTHEFVDMVSKLSADKGVSFDFTNNTKLKNSGFAIDGKQVNGFVNQNGITVNIDSANALNTVVGHEITHVLEGTELYTELQKAVKEYATTKGVYDTKLAELTEMYKNVEGANVENELTSDLVGEYIFKDTDFINNLSTTQPNVFKKIYNEIKYLLKIATSGSKEARQLEKVKKAFDEAYRNSGTTLTNDTKYSVSDEKITKTINELKVELDNAKGFFARGAIQEQINALENGFNTINDYRNYKEQQKEKSIKEREEKTKLEEERKQQELKDKQEKLKREIEEASPLKRSQYEIIQKYNPMLDDYHTGIRSPKDILTFDETINDPDSFAWGDFSKKDAEKALKKGEITVYSSYPINQGVFVSTSKVQAEEYAGGTGKKIHSKTVPINEVAWINGDEGQYAKVNDTNYSLSENNDISPIKQGNLTYGEDVKIAPTQEEINNNFNDRLNEIADRLDKELTPQAINEDTLQGLEQQYEENFNNIDEAYEPETEATYNDNLDFIDMDAKETLKQATNGEASNREVNRLYKEVANANSVDEVKRLLSDYNSIYEVDPEVKQIRNHIKSTPISMDSINALTGNKNEFRKSNFGKLKLTKNGVSADVLYQELNSSYPQYFPNDITTEGDQLEAIADFMNYQDGKQEVFQKSNQMIEEEARQIYDSVKMAEFNEINSKLPIPKEYIDAINLEEIKPLSRETFENRVNESNKQIEDEIGYIPKDPTKESSYDEIAKVLTEEPKAANQESRLWAKFKANVLDKGAVFEDLSLKTKNRELMARWDYTLTAQARAQNVIGNGHTELNPLTKETVKTSKSLNEIREEVGNTGLTQEFSDYIYHKHNVDRMNLESKAKAEKTKLENQLKETTDKETIKEIKKEIEALDKVKNKPVFGDSVTSTDSQAIVDKYEKSNPKFVDYANDIYDYLKADRQELVKNGVISQDTAKLWDEMYPHYVPIRREGDTGTNINVPLDTGRTGINAPIKAATGGNSNILPLFDTIAMRTLQTYKATSKNSFGVELKNTLNTNTEINQTNVDEVIDSVDNQESLLQEGKNGRNPTFTVFENGEKVTYEISKDMYDALKPLSDSSLLNTTFKPFNTISNIHRGVLTQYNLFFALTNAVKDAQDVLMNSQHALKTYSKVPEAWAQQLKKGYWYQEYMANGGEQNSYFDNQDHTFMAEKKGLSKLTDMFPLKTISTINDFIEMTPRLSEYIASREAGRSIQESMLDAARVTTNFKAGGDLVKWANRNGATFLNASVQGFNQQVRNIREANAQGLKGWATLATKFAVAGLPALLLNGLLWDDDDDYAELSDYVKQNYYVVAKYGDGQFIRIPKGRTLAVIQNAFEQVQDVITGNDEADLGEFTSILLNNLAPNNPIENNVLSPIIQAATNTNWYGGDLVPQRLQDMPAAEQYDETTDSLSKWLGEKLNISPYKINYVMNQYTGFLGDMFMPMATPEAKNDADSIGDYLIAPLKDKFTVDSTMKNQNTSEIYETSDELTTNAKKSNATTEDVLKNKFINAIKSEMNDLYKQKREIQNSDLSNAEKYNQVREVQKQINEIAKYGVNNYEDLNITGNYATVGNREYRLTTDSEGNETWNKITDKQKEKQENVSNTIGVSAAEYWANKEEYDYAYDSPEKYAISQTVGGYENFKTYSKDINELESDKDESGKTINGSKKQKVFDYINNLDLEFEQKVILAKTYYSSYDEYNNDIIEYLNNSDISYDDEVKILKGLGFEVDSDGTIRW